MDKENEFKPGDLVQHKATREFSVVLKEKNQDEKVKARKSDGEKDTFFDFELVPVKDSIVAERLNTFRHHETINPQKGKAEK